MLINPSAGSESPFPGSGAWQIEYDFVVPPLPCSATWNPNSASFYIWGDVDFDLCGSGSTYPLSTYVYSQIVPQLMIGDVLDGNTASYAPWGGASARG